MAGSAGMPKTCQETTVNTEPLIPTVAIVVDNSSSMYRPESDPPFDKLQDALMDPTTGAIKPLESKMRLGFYSFRSPKNHPVPENDPTCADMTSVPFALDNYDEVNAAYQQVGVDRLRPTGCSATPNMSGCEARDWDTPTGFALNKVAADLMAYNPDPPGKKNILFVTDGTPNTCMIGDPNCGQDQTIKAYQDAFAAGIGGYIVGIGDALGESCDPNATHCGADYLQDMANAGAGQPVAQQPMSYWYSAMRNHCVRHQPGHAACDVRRRRRSGRHGAVLHGHDVSRAAFGADGAPEHLRFLHVRHGRHRHRQCREQPRHPPGHAAHRSATRRQGGFSKPTSIRSR